MAHNLRQARDLWGLTQEEAAERLAPFLTTRARKGRWSGADVSIAERSVDADARGREFTADDVFAFALAFDLPVTYFLIPPGEPVDVQVGTNTISNSKVLELVFGATEESIAAIHEALKGVPESERGEQVERMQWHARALAAMVFRTVTEDAQEAAKKMLSMGRWLEEFLEMAEESYDRLVADLREKQAAEADELIEEELLRRVADIYREAVEEGEHVGEAIMNRLDMSPEEAVYLLAEALVRGLIEPAPKEKGERRKGEGVRAPSRTG